MYSLVREPISAEDEPDSHPHTPLCNPFLSSKERERERERRGVHSRHAEEHSSCCTQGKKRKRESSATIERSILERRRKRREKEIRRTARGEWRIINLKGRRYKRETRKSSSDPSEFFPGSLQQPPPSVRQSLFPPTFLSIRNISSITFFFFFF